MIPPSGIIAKDILIAHSLIPHLMMQRRRLLMLRMPTLMRSHAAVFLIMMSHVILVLLLLLLRHERWVVLRHHVARQRAEEVDVDVVVGEDGVGCGSRGGNAVVVLVVSGGRAGHVWVCGVCAAAVAVVAACCCGDVGDSSV